ncbi:phytanoyl-CoA dioxygenase family protein [Larkinella terrae]|uniref:Phytanoyl-CoA dioxygenase n=1 Tax=Larkinella terrae TaxID=2025311 RepID=A0A7K0EGL7_9BACT|nr:phytanoyl-CoA dioxygenase family protein [Larkinella terrae]MRS60989.1 phytanoyl-CoA dioxygenase [Larkinella terrae]
MSIVNKARQAYHKLFPAPVLKDFPKENLPWIDQKNPDIEGFVKQFPKALQLPYDLTEKLHFWKENGYVILEQVISDDLIDAYLADVQELIEKHKEYDITIRIDRPEYVKHPVMKVRDVPREIIEGQYIKVMDFHNASVAGKKLMLHKAIVSFLEAIFNEKVVAMQSLTFLYGSQQETHQDFPYVVPQVPSHLAAAWIALEDVKPGSGELHYYVGSHKIQKFNWGNGIFFNAESTKNPTDFGKYLSAECERLGLEKKTLLIKKGDVLIWHAALAHGGEPILDDNLTRKSYVCHYSSALGYFRHRHDLVNEPIRINMNGADVFADPKLTSYEDSFKRGVNIN